MNWKPVLLALALGCLVATVQNAAAEDTICPGTSMLAEIERDRPELWQSALAEFQGIPNGTGLLWKLEKPGIAASWLLGTIHAPDPRVTALTEPMKSALAAADTLVLETTELFEGARGEIAVRLMQEAKMPDGESFDAGFTPAQKEALGKLTAAIGMPYFLARQIEPWLLVISLSVPPCVQVAMLRGETGVDGTLYREAKKAGMQILGIETTEEQLELMKSFEAAIGVDSLLEVVATGPGMIENVFATMVELYVEERPTLIVPLSRKMPEFKLGADSFRQVEDALVITRNQRMRERLLPILEKGAAFVAVGALHLSGREGLIELLRDSGYSVTRVEG